MATLTTTVQAARFVSVPFSCPEESTPDTGWDTDGLLLGPLLSGPQALLRIERVTDEAEKFDPRWSPGMGVTLSLAHGVVFGFVHEVDEREMVIRADEAQLSAAVFGAAK